VRIDGRFGDAALAAALFVLLAFVVSFVAGLRIDRAAPPPPAPDPAAARPAPPVRLPRVRVEVLNAAGRPGLARLATERLRESGFDVVFFGNAGEFGRERTAVIDRVGNPEHAAAVAHALGVADVATEPDPSRLVEVSVVLGQDWPPPLAPRERGPWARLVGFLRGLRGDR